MSGKRNPDKTREDLLQAGFHEIHKNGFRAADVNVMLAEAGVTKGALYHHFGSKKGLGFAVIDEVVCGMVLTAWVRPLRQADDPIDAMIRILRDAAAGGEKHIKFGCPLNNLAQELTAVDEEFRQRVERIYDLWRQGLVEGLARGQASGTVRADVVPEDVATFLVATCQGTMGLAKSSQSVRHLEACVQGIAHYLETLRPQAVPAAASAAADAAAAH